MCCVTPAIHVNGPSKCKKTKIFSFTCDFLITWIIYPKLCIVDIYKREKGYIILRLKCVTFYKIAKKIVSFSHSVNKKNHLNKYYQFINIKSNKNVFM